MVLGMEPNATVSNDVPGSSPPGSNDVATGVGYAYNLTMPGVPHLQPKLYLPWGGCPPGATIHNNQDSNDSEGYMSHMANMAAESCPVRPGSGRIPGPMPGAMARSFGGFDGPTIKRDTDIDNQPVSPPPTRERFSYTRYQLELLNGIFTKVRYPNSMQKQLIAKRVGITRDQVKIWFQNRRRKDVIGKGTSKDEYSDRRMVTEEVLSGILKELLRYENDPKGRKVKDAKTRAMKSRTTKSTERNSFNSVSEDSNTKSPPPIRPMDNIVSEPYQPNCMAFGGSLGPPPSLMPMTFGGSCVPSHSGAPLTRTTPQHVSPPVSRDTVAYPDSGHATGIHTLYGNGVSMANSIHTNNLKLTEPQTHTKSDNSTILSTALESVPLPVAGQGLALPVESESDGDAAKVDQRAELETPEGDTCKSITILAPVDESSNDSNFSVTNSSVVSEDTSNSSQYSSVTNTSNPIDISAPPNVVAPNCVVGASRPLKRSRSCDSLSSDDLEEPPRKRQEKLAETTDDIVPPNKIAPPSGPIKFDSSKVNPPTTSQLTVNIPGVIRSPQRGDVGNKPCSPIIIAPKPQHPLMTEHQPWNPWPNRPGEMRLGSAAVPMMPYVNTDMGHLHQAPIIPHYKSPCAPDIPWPPFRDFYSLPPPTLAQPWDSSPTVDSQHGADPKQSADNALLNSFLAADPFKMINSFTGIPEDLQRPHHLPINRPDNMPPWMLTPYANPHFGPPPINNIGDKPTKFQ